MRSIFVLAMVAILFSSCKKDETPSITNPSSSSQSYVPLKVGNYWVYEIIEVRPDGSTQLLDTRDSVYVERDTIIHGKKYFVLNGTSFLCNGHHGHAILRDSMNTLISHTGNVIFSLGNFGDTISTSVRLHGVDTLYTEFINMEVVNGPISVPAGTFSALESRRSILTPEEIDGHDNPRNYATYYAKGIGRIYEENGYLIGTTRFEKRLVRYHIEP